MAQAYEQKEITENKDIANKISVCDLLKGNTTKIIKKLESQTPTFVQLHCEFYDEYLHMLEDLYGACYISEKQFFDNLGLDQKSLNALDKFWAGVTDTAISYIDMYTNFRKAQFRTMTSFMKSNDHFAHVGMDYWASLMSEMNSKK